MWPRQILDLGKQFNLMIRLENVSKTSWRSFWKTSRRRFGDLFKKSCQDVLKIYWGSFCKTSWKRPENVLKTSCLEDVLKTSWRSLEDVWPRQKILVLIKTCRRHIQDVFWRDMTRANVFVLIKTSWRRLLKRKTKNVFNTSSRRLHQDECFLEI